MKLKIASLNKVILSVVLFFVIFTAPAHAEDQSNIACYFQDLDGNVAWQWALNSDDSWLEIKGEWRRTSYSGIMKFFSQHAYGDICQACNNAKQYYGEKGELIATFAAVSNAGHNYPLVLHGVQINPNY